MLLSLPNPMACTARPGEPRGAGRAKLVKQSKMLRATGHARMVGRSYGTVDIACCQTLPGLPRTARPSGRFAEGKMPRRGV